MSTSSNVEQKKFLTLSTFQLAFGLATGKFSESEKLEVLGVIEQREPTRSYKNDQAIVDNSTNTTAQAHREVTPKKTKRPLPGSKAAKILTLLEMGKTPGEVVEALEKKKVNIYAAEVYRLKKNYGL